MTRKPTRAGGGSKSAHKPAPGAASSKGALGERHQDLLSALERIFLAEGYRHLTVDELAARLKCSKRTLYEIAKSKHEIFLLVLERLLDRIRHMGSLGAFKHDDPAQRIQAFMEPGFLETVGASARFVEDLRSLRPAYLLLEAHQRERVNVLRDIVEEGIGRGRFNKLHAHLVAEAYHAAIERMNDPDFLRRAGLTYAEAFSELFQLIAFGLVRREGAGAKGSSGGAKRS